MKNREDDMLIKSEGHNYTHYHAPSEAMTSRTGAEMPALLFLCKGRKSQ